MSLSKFAIGSNFHCILKMLTVYLHGYACTGEGSSPGQVSFWPMAVMVYSEDALGFMDVEFTCQEGSVPGVA